MKPIQQRAKHPERISVRIPSDVAAWLGRASYLRRVPASIIIREAILDKFAGRNKGQNKRGK